MAAHEDEVPSGPRPSGVPDERLRLMFTCCHPALAIEARVALTLRTLGGLSTAEIARAFLVPEATMANASCGPSARSNTPVSRTGYRPPHELPERAAGVLAVLYLLFNEGYSATAGERDGPARASASRRCGWPRCWCRLMPDEPEAIGLLALMLFHRARQAARVDGAGDLVLLEDQDRTSWHAEAITEANACSARGPVASPRPLPAPSSHRGCHARPDGRTDWAEVSVLYDALYSMSRSPVIALNRAVAVSMSSGPEAGLALADEVEQDGALRGYHLLPAARADMLRPVGTP